ncbi:hypothetical protein L7F22_050142 [Adiantum nelumboides]|nr:hypothetical protein [Adiantum nelumboides]
MPNKGKVRKLFFVLKQQAKFWPTPSHKLHHIASGLSKLCTILLSAQKVLEELHIQSLVSWGAIIAGYAQQGQDGYQAYALVKNMLQQGFESITYLFTGTLKACGMTGSLTKGILLHALIAETNCESGIAVGSALVDISCISWLSKKQPIVATSSCEAKYRAVFTATIECVWLRRLMADLDVGQSTANTIYTDSQSALVVARNPNLHARTKHIEVPYHYVRERLSAEEIILAYVAYVPTQDNLADIFTKALSREKLEAFRKTLGLLPFVD